MARSQHRFSAHLALDLPSHGKRVEGDSFEAAAIAFAEHWACDDAGEVAVIVHDRDTGREECFRVHVDSGEAEPCS